MFHRISFLTLGLLIVACGASGYSQAAHAAGKKKATKTHHHLSSKRGIASLAPDSIKVMGQGEAMLYSMKDSQPRFLSSGAAGSGPVKLAGVCRDAFGMTYNSTQRGYSNCLDSRRSGTVNQTFEAQRQAGVGVLVGP